jgi:hypothetical protein
VNPGVDVPDANVNAGHVAQALADGGVGHIDADGIDSSTYLLARATLGRQRVRAYKGSAPTGWRDKARVLSFVNTWAAAWWALREAIDPSSGREIALPPDRELHVELCSPRWEPQANGVKIEMKKDIKKRLGGRSTDKADGVVMAHWDDTRNRLGAALAKAREGPVEQEGARDRVLARQARERARSIGGEWSQTQSPLWGSPSLLVRANMAPLLGATGGSSRPVGGC